MLAVPAATAVARPEAEIVAVDGVSLDQVTCELISAAEPSQLSPVAVYCWVAPTVIATGTAGVITIEDSAITVIATGGLVTPFNCAVILVVPAFKPVITLLLTEATVGLELPQTTLLETSGVVPSE
jgi:hypothetical protein